MLSDIPTLLDDISAGRMVILMDDEDRENEGDLIIAAEKATPEIINFFATEACGLICMPITPERARQLNLPLMVRDNRSQHETNFTVSIDATEQVGPGVSAALEKHGIHHLRNESVKTAGLRLIGVDDHWTRNDDVDRAMAGVGQDEPKLMLLHSPDLVHQAADAGVHLALAGHTHGGQVRLPFYGALIVPSAFGFEQGWYRSGDTRLYVNRGLGTLEMKVRVHCRPEVHELTLLPA